MISFERLPSKLQAVETIWITSIQYLTVFNLFLEMIRFFVSLENEYNLQVYMACKCYDVAEYESQSGSSMHTHMAMIIYQGRSISEFCKHFFQLSNDILWGICHIKQFIDE